MKTHFTGLAVAALLAIGATLPGHAQDAAAPKATAAPAAAQTPAATPADAPPPSVPRPSLAPKTAEPASQPVTEEAAPRHHRYAHRHWRRYGYYHTAYWEPFPIYWPHIYHNRIHWSRMPWIFPF